MLASSNSNLSPAAIRGIVPAEEAAVSQLEQLLTVGSLGDLQPGVQRIILGRFLAARLGVGVGDQVTLLAPGVDDGRLTAAAGRIPSSADCSRRGFRSTTWGWR